MSSNFGSFELIQLISTSFETKTKARKLREDIRLFAPNSKQAVLRIATRQIIDFGATYDVFDSA